LATFKSRFKELAFYVDGKLKKFHAGQYVTKSAKETKIVDALKDTEHIDEPAEQPKASAK
jgi:hypothetical protein